jgi:hypothetical protein
MRKLKRRTHVLMLDRHSTNMILCYGRRTLRPRELWLGAGW